MSASGATGVVRIRKAEVGRQDDVSGFRLPVYSFRVLLFASVFPVQSFRDGLAPRVSAEIVHIYAAAARGEGAVTVSNGAVSDGNDAVTVGNGAVAHKNRAVIVGDGAVLCGSRAAACGDDAVRCGDSVVRCSDGAVKQSNG